MAFNPLLIPTLLVALLACWGGVKLAHRPLSRLALIGLVAAGVLLALPAFLFVIYYLHVLDGAAWFYQLRAARFSELSAAGAGVITGIACGKIGSLLIE